MNAVAHLVETLLYKLEGAGSIPIGVVEIFQWHNPYVWAG